MKLVILFFLIFFITEIFSQSIKPVETVKYVDIKKYLGLWYEIAKLPNSFQKKCSKNTTAEYRLLENNKLEVVNSCIESDGDKNIVQGIAKIVDDKTNAKLEVSFFSIFGIRPFWGDYWIIGLGTNYEYAVVGTPSRKYAWILSRTRILPKQYLDEALEILKIQGFDISKLEFSLQE